MALYSLNYDPNTLLSEKSSNTKSNIHISSNLLLPKSEAFQMLYNLAQEEHFTDAYNWIGKWHLISRLYIYIYVQILTAFLSLFNS